MAAKTRKPCLCSKFEFGTTIDLENGDVDFEGHNTGCNETTLRTFAMGHDAKLAGFLVRAEIAGLEIVLEEGGVRTTFGGSVEAAASISDGLAAKVQRMLEVAARRVIDADLRADAKAAKKAGATPAPAPVAAPEVPATRTAKIKVGRWTYTAQINTATGRATWKSKLGLINETEQGKYTEIA